MAQTTPNLGLKVWNLSTDPYDYTQLANNFISIDRHDHSPGNGALIDGANGIKPGSIGASQLGPNSVSSGNIVDGSVGASEIADGVITSSKISTNAGFRVQGNNIESYAITPDKLTPGLTPVTSTSSTSNIQTSLPTSGPNGTTLYDGYTIDYSNSPADYVWRLRYGTSDSKWHFVGGAQLGSYQTTLTTYTFGSSTNYFSLATNNASVTVPLTGTYRVILHCTGAVGNTQNGTYTIYHSLGINGTALDTNASNFTPTWGANNYDSASVTLKVSLSATDVLTSRFKSANAGDSTTNLYIKNNSIEIIPITLG